MGTDVLSKEPKHFQGCQFEGQSKYSAPKLCLRNGRRIEKLAMRPYRIQLSRRREATPSAVIIQKSHGVFHLKCELDYCLNNNTVIF